MALLSRFSALLLSIPLYLSKPALRAARARRRHAHAKKVHELAAAQAVPPPLLPEVMRAPRELLIAMRDELRNELAAHAAEGTAFAHLARFEEKFSKRGLRTLDEIPVDHLRRALADFEVMVRNWSSAALADLRSRMAVHLADRTSASTMWIAANSIAPLYGIRAGSAACRPTVSGRASDQNSGATEAPT